MGLFSKVNTKIGDIMYEWFLIAMVIGGVWGVSIAVLKELMEEGFEKKHPIKAKIAYAGGPFTILFLIALFFFVMFIILMSPLFCGED